MNGLALTPRESVTSPNVGGGLGRGLVAVRRFLVHPVNPVKIKSDGNVTS